MNNQLYLINFLKQKNTRKINKYSFVFLFIFTLPFSACSNPITGNEHLNNFKQQSNQKWVGTWSSSPQSNTVFLHPYVIPPLKNQTIRNIVRVSLGGSIIRVRLSNTYGDKNLDIGSASIGIGGGESTILPNTLRVLSFGGKPSISIPPGADIYSDPIELRVKDNSDLAVNIFIAGTSPLPTIDDITNKNSYILSTGDYTRSEESPSDAQTTRFTYFLSGIDVKAKLKTNTIVVLGDSIIDGVGSTFDANNSFINVFALRLLKNRNFRNTSLLNASISGNRLLGDASVFSQNALARADRDVFSQSNITHLILGLGINDIGWPNIASLLPNDTFNHVTSEQLIAGMKQLAVKAKTRGIKVYSGTLLPFKGAPYYTSEGETIRKKVNHWIRTSNTFNAIIDFDKALRDPNDFEKIKGDLTSDYLHPNDAGYAKMAHSINLNLFR